MWNIYTDDLEACNVKCRRDDDLDKGLLIWGLDRYSAVKIQITNSGSTCCQISLDYTRKTSKAATTDSPEFVWPSRLVHVIELP